MKTKKLNTEVWSMLKELEVIEINYHDLLSGESLMLEIYYN